jgi:hypothetical protein
MLTWKVGREREMRNHSKEFLVYMKKLVPLALAGSRGKAAKSCHCMSHFKANGATSNHITKAIYILHELFFACLFYILPDMILFSLSLSLSAYKCWKWTKGHSVMPQKSVLISHHARKFLSYFFFFSFWNPQKMVLISTSGQ